MQSFVPREMSDGVLNAVCYVTCVGDIGLISSDPPAAAAAAAIAELVLETWPRAQSRIGNGSSSSSRAAQIHPQVSLQLSVNFS